MSLLLQDHEKKALVRLQLKGDESEFGFATKICVPDKQDPEERNVLLITSASIFPDNIDEHLDDIVVHRWKAKSKQKDPAKVKNIENHKKADVSTVVFEGGDKKLCHTLQCKVLTEKDLKRKEHKKLSACVFEGEKTIVLEFQKEDGSYRLSNVSKEGFDEKRAKGAPVIIGTGTLLGLPRYAHKVVGVLSIDSNGDLYPVLFKDGFLAKEEEELIEKFDTKMRIKQKASQFEILDGDIVEDGENRVQAHLAVITSKDQVEQVLAELKKKDPDVAKATHNIWAYRIFDAEKDTYHENCDDDGDDSSGARVLRFLQKNQATDIMVVVSCWYETTAEDFWKNTRFKCLKKSVLDLLLTRYKKFYEEIKYTPFEKAKEKETPKFDILHGETIEDRKSTFQAHLADITSREQVDQVLAELMKDRKIAKATYNMWASRIYNEKKKSYFQEGNDDGENLGGERLLHLLQRRDAKNVVIVVTRWHGGIHLGNDRFKHINKCASDLLQQRRIVETRLASTDPKAVEEVAVLLVVVGFVLYGCTHYGPRALVIDVIGALLIYLTYRAYMIYFVDDDDLGAAEISIDEMGGSYDVSRNGVSLYFPPNAVDKCWVVTCSVQSEDYSPSPAGADETLVSNIVELGPNDVDIRQPIKVTLMHSGPGRDLGYETAVKAFNKDKDVWEEIEELNDKSHPPEHSIQVEISKLTILAVVTRLITDRFQVTPKGCVVRSSVCDDVTIEFPEGAVDKTVDGTLKLMFMCEIIHHSKDACPILCMDGFSSITFPKPVIVKMLIPDNTAEYSTNEIRLFRLEDNKWEDVTHEVHIVTFKTHIEFHVKHFSCLWPWMSEAKIKFASKIFQYLRSSPQVVCFAAFKDNEEASGSVQKLTLVCVANHKQREIISNMKDEGYSRLAVATGDRRMRPNDKAYLRINGADVRHVGVTSFFLSFLKSEVCRKEMSVRDKEQDDDNLGEMVVKFFFNTNFDLLLCTLPMSKDKVFSRSGGPENPSAQQLPVVEQAQPVDKTDDFVGKCDLFAMHYQHHVPASDLEETIRLLKHSIGAIFAKNVSGVELFGGTCFRIGPKYVITCQHVIDDIKKLGIHLSNCWVDFNYGEGQPGQPGQPGKRFGFTCEPLLAFSPEENLDYAILELYPNGLEGFPRSVTELGFKIAPPGRQLKGGECLTLYGHPERMKKRIDVSCPIKRKKDIQNLQHTNEFPTIQKFYSNPHCATYDVSTFFWGSSGSPGLLTEEKLLVVLHSGGIPIQVTNEHVLEYGHLMSSVVEDVKKKINNGTIPNVTNADEIFGPLTSPSNGDSPQPMDIDPQNELSACGQ